MRRLLESSMLGAAPRAILEQLVERRRGATPGLVNRIVAGTGDVDSAQPARRLWSLSRLVAARSPALTAAFDAGLDGIVERTAGTALEPEIDAFLRDHGHRGNDEYELASPAWVMDPRPVYASIDRLRHVPDERDPDAIAEQLRADAESRWPRPSGSRLARSAGWCAGRPPSPAWVASRESEPRTSSCARTSPPGACCTSWFAGPPSAAAPPTRAWRSA